MAPRFLRMAIVLGLITAVGPFAIDMYLPAMPSMGSNLHASPDRVQATLMVFFVTIGVCQLIYGPLSDIVGRKAPIYAGLAVFAFGSIGCALSPSIGTLIFFRVVQALGACAGMVVPRAIVRDMHTGHEATKLMSLLMLVVSVSPILAPISGSLLIGTFGWRGVFVTLTVAAALAFILAVTQLKETRPPEQRAESSWRSAFDSYRRLGTDSEFISLCLVGAFGVSSFFVYIESASFVLINYYGLTPKLFSLCFALNAASFFGFSQLTGLFARKYGLASTTRVAVVGFALATTLLAALSAFGVHSLVVMEALLMVGYGFLGLVLPASGVLALEKHGEIAGSASALMGSVQMVVGSAIMAVAGIFANGRPGPMLMGIAACALACLAVTQFALRPSPAQTPVLAE